MSALRKPEAAKRRQHRVHTAVVDGAVRRVKFCPGCDRELIAEAGASDSAFYVNMRTAKGTPIFYPRCKECRTRIERERRLRDPEYAKRVRERERAATRRWVEASDENREKAREACLRYYHRMKAEDPERVNGDARMYYALRKERRGEAVKRNRPTVVDATCPRFPAEKFGVWLAAYRDAVRLFEFAELADHLGINVARVSRTLRGVQGSIAQDVVDAALLNARAVVCVDGRPIVTLDDLYPREGP